MVRFTARLKRFEKQGEKTGWTFIEISSDIAEKIKPGTRKSYRVKGKLDKYPISQVALVPMGGGQFILAVNAAMRKGIGKKDGAMVKAELEEDASEKKLSGDFLDCLADEPRALKYFESLPKGHRNYFSNWIESAKTEPTKTKRISLAVNALAREMGYPEMIREEKKRRDELG